MILRQQLSLVQEPEDEFIEVPGLVQGPEGGFVTEAPGLVQELVVGEVHAPHWWGFRWGSGVATNFGGKHIC